MTVYEDRDLRGDTLVLLLAANPPVLQILIDGLDMHAQTKCWKIN